MDQPIDGVAMTAPETEDPIVLREVEITGSKPAQTGKDIAYSAQTIEEETRKSRRAKKKAEKKAAKESVRDVAAIEMADVHDLDASRNVLTYDSAGAAEDANVRTEIEAFQWLLGQWSAVDDQQEVSQQWVQRNNFSLDGQAVFNVNGQPYKVQRMQILKEPDGVYFIVASLDNSSEKRFRLKSIDNQQAIFEFNKKNALPEEITFQKLNKDTFLNFSNAPRAQYEQAKEGLLFNNLNYSRIKN
ncbi:MAG: hypothetical protein HKN16_03380 [Saprospiraceae bacterium]|nr:hypothetical protein [Saprospiraceae bacterium]